MTPSPVDGQETPGLTAEQLADDVHEASTPPPPRPARGHPPAALLGGGMLPAPLLAAKVAGTAKIVPIIHPGDATPERRYIPSAVLATFIRCRDMTCRFPGCDEPAHHCDIDHTIAYPTGPTQASNLKCLCRKHHLLKTSAAGTTNSHLTAPWYGPHHTGRPTPPTPAAEYCSRPCAHPPQPWSTATRPSTATPDQPRPGHAAPQPHPRPKPHHSHQRRTPTQPNPGPPNASPNATNPHPSERALRLTHCRSARGHHDRGLRVAKHRSGARRIRRRIQLARGLRPSREDDYRVAVAQNPTCP